MNAAALVTLPDVPNADGAGDALMQRRPHDYWLLLRSAEGGLHVHQAFKQLQALVTWAEKAERLVGDYKPPPKTTSLFSGVLAPWAGNLDIDNVGERTDLAHLVEASRLLGFGADLHHRLLEFTVLATRVRKDLTRDRGQAAVLATDYKMMGGYAVLSLKIELEAAPQRPPPDEDDYSLMAVALGLESRQQAQSTDGRERWRKRVAPIERAAKLLEKMSLHAVTEQKR